MHGRILTCTKLTLKVGYDFKSYLFKQISTELCNVPGTGGNPMCNMGLHMAEQGKRDRCSVPL